jgi:NAD(P)-dependent dehydrogenase (short-subunit alcohol dehydrogenase family)
VTDASWSPADIPDLTGRSAVVTGANSGIGFHTALGLARAGADVVMACRDAARGEEALRRARQLCPGGRLELRTLDLADLAGVRDFASTVAGRLDLLVNNAGVMATPQRRTRDGFELQLGTNHLGHFALTGLLLPAMLRDRAAGEDARVVTVSSMMHRTGRLRRDDLMHSSGYQRWRVYGQAKLANLLFALELQRRLDAAALPVRSLAAHPGFAATNLQAVGPEMDGRAWLARLSRWGSRLVAQGPEAGSWPTLRAATDPSAPGGTYFGPGGLGGARGAPVVEAPSPQAMDAGDAAWLWERSVELTGVDFAALPAARHDG